MIDGATPIWPIGMTRSAATPSDGRQAVRDAQAEGYDFVKAYERLDVDTWAAMMDEARSRGPSCATGRRPCNASRSTTIPI